MDYLFISEKVLNQQVCMKCLCYLSVGPIMISRGGNIICGRCRPTAQAELTLLNRSLYNLVAEKVVFKCINYYQGCEELLSFNEAKVHEKYCKEDGFVCFFCDFKGNGCQLVHHFNKIHPECEVVMDDTFKIIIKETVWRNLIFVKKDIIFCLIFAARDSFIEFFNLLMSSAHLGPKHFKLRFFKMDTNIEFVTSLIKVTHELRKSSSNTFLAKNIRFDTISNQLAKSDKKSLLLHQTLLLDCFPSGSCMCKIELINNSKCETEENQMKHDYLKKIDTKLPGTDVSMAVEKNNKKNFDINNILSMTISSIINFALTELRANQTCVNCGRYIQNSVYFCPKSHMACKNCLSSKCVTCGEWCVWNSNRPQFNIKLPCEWTGCNRRPQTFNYAIHKRDCKMRSYECPDVECEFKGSIVELKEHWHMNPICDYISIYSYSEGIFFWYIDDFHELVRVSVECRGEKLLHVTIWEVNAVMFTNYQFSIGQIVPERVDNHSVTFSFQKKSVDNFLGLQIHCRL